MEYAEEIKNRVTMRDICDRYGLAVNHANKAVCPFHKDKHASMHVYPGSRGFHCFACGAGGDVINFVMAYHGIPFLAAVKRINDDFKLGLPVDGQSDDERRKARKAAEARRKARERERMYRQGLQDRYEAAMDYYASLDRVLVENEPDGDTGAVSDDYAWAALHIDEAWNMVQDAIDALNKYDTERERR